ncbi:neurturin [Denticeps clupeoides]|uniref:TGF-beta family profile domain-containing protein n=1 Tax=Denticeps clupeoides TaxID=299321 RepID=A0AAY3ZXP4_9TELE|nr:neurturin-like [Denticeps clupeoides]XP_028832300.1 neurturin-like [Denticeps clupeoides]
MKLWKGATLAITLCCASLSFLFPKTDMPAEDHPRVAPERAWSAPASPPPAQRSLPGRARVVRDADGVGSLLSEFSNLFQSFTEGELKQVVGMLVDRKVRRDSLVQSWRESEEDRQSRRTKRARKGLRQCSLQEVELTVSELGLGYESDETILFRYCSGKCTARRRNYDIILEHLQKGHQGQRSDESVAGRRRKDKGQYSPCCRPVRYEKNMSFLGNNNVFYTISNVSARECGCV